MIRSNKKYRNSNSWTETALECYEIGATCIKCQLPEYTKRHCHMRNKILEIVRIYGKPYDRKNNFLES